MRPTRLIVPFLSLAILVTIGGCPPRKEGALPAVSPAMATDAKEKWPDSDGAQLERGRTVVAERCTRCHARPGPGLENVKEWPSVVARMAKKAKLDDKDREAVLRYMLVARGN